MQTYKDAGIDYEVLDAAKREALRHAVESLPSLASHGAAGKAASLGSPAFVFELAGSTLALVVECLGTKSVVAREYQEASGANRFADIGYDAVAAIVNDLSSVGALPLVVNAYFATGSPAWYQDRGRAQALLEGWARACRDASAAWGGGESPSLPGLVAEDDIEIAGGAVGVVPPGGHALLGDELAAGDEIVLVASNGLHANGSSLARTVAAALPEGYRTRLPSGRELGDALLRPAFVYSRLVAQLWDAKVPVTYLSHITGHGLRKLMRAKAELSYRISTLPPVPEELEFLQRHAGMEPGDAYGTLNMGAGLAIFCRPGGAGAVIAAASECGFDAWLSGQVQAGARQVVLEPIDVAFSSEDLELS